MKKYNVFKILTIAILVTMLLSYFIPSTSMSYGTVTKGSVEPVPFVESFTNGLTSLSVFITTFIYILSIGIFYATLIKTKKYEVLVNNIAASFKKNRTLFLALTIFILGIVTMFTGNLFVMLVFVPLLMSVIKKLGFKKEVAVASTIGAILLGSTGTIYTYYINQMLSRTISDSVVTRVVVSIVSLVALLVFILVFNDRPEKSSLEKTKEKKMLPLYITLICLFVLFILGFVNWKGYFGFEGFDTFLTNLRKAEISKVSVFDAIVGKSVVAFGSFELQNAAVLILFISVLISIIYRLKINDFFENLAEGIKKALPYALIAILANIVLVNLVNSGVMFTIMIGLTEKAVNMFTGTLTAILAALGFPDYTYSVQFTMTSVMANKESIAGNEGLFSSLFQAVYSLFLLISPTSILLLMGLKLNEVRYKDWIKYIYKFFIVLFVAILIALKLTTEKIDFVAIAAASLFVIALGIIFYLRISKVSKRKTSEKKETTKVEVKQIKEEKKEESKKNKKSKNKK